jgi:hypothetical protein
MRKYLAFALVALALAGGIVRLQLNTVAASAGGWLRRQQLLTDQRRLIV